MSLLSTESILRELSYISWQIDNINDFLEAADAYMDNINATPDEYNKVTKKLKLDILDVEKYVKDNNWQCVSDPRAFVSQGLPSSKGLLSNEIFGFTMEERSNIYAYIDLHGWFMDPSCYKAWIRLDTKVRNIVHGVKNYIIDEHGYFIEDENGETGIEFIRKNINKIKFKESASSKKQMSIKYLEQNRDRIFIKKYIVIPPFYRDKNTSAGGKTVGLGGVNKLYNNLIVATNALTSTQEFGFDASDAMNGRVQEIILQIYDWFCGNNNKSIEEPGQGLSGKLGILRMTNTSKTSNFSSRLVISAVDLKVERPEDLEVNFDRTSIPLYAVMTEFRDFIMYHVRTFFENEFAGIETYPVVTAKGVEKTIIPETPEIVFSDERIEKEMDRFLHGYNNRFVPIEVPVEGTNQKYYMKFKGRGVSIGEAQESKNPLTQRRLTWCDVFYLSAVEATRDKHILCSRFPIINHNINTNIIVL